MKKLTAIAVLISICITGCYTDKNGNLRFSDEEMYTFSDIDRMLNDSMTIGFTYVDTEREDDNRKVSHTFIADDGVEFTASSYLYKTDYAIFDRAGMSFDYPLKWFEDKHETIASIIGEQFDFEFLWYGLDIYISEYEHLQPVSELISELLSAFPPISVTSEGEEYYNRRPEIHVSVIAPRDEYDIDVESNEPQRKQISYSSGFTFPIEYEFSPQSQPSNADDVFVLLREKLLDSIEQGWIRNVHVDEEVFDNHPKSRLGRFIILGESFQVWLPYSEEHDDYYTDFTVERNAGGETVNHYEFTVESNFPLFIQAVGGTYEVDADKTNSTVNWIIDDDVYRMDLTVETIEHESFDVKYEHIAGLTVYKNDEELSLSAASGTGRFMFTFADLELMTGKTITVERAKGRAVIE